MFTFHMITLSGEKPKEKASFYYHSGFALNQVKKPKTKQKKLDYWMSIQKLQLVLFQLDIKIVP